MRRANPIVAFTLVELLVVIAIIMILAALIMPTLRHAQDQAVRAQCTSQLRQWGTAFWAYAASNQRFFPDNRDGVHTSWVGRTVQLFCKNYLLEMGTLGGQQHMRAEHIIHCPTQEWHRIAGTYYPGDYSLNLIGYFILPHRSVGSPHNQADYTYAGNEWVTKRLMSDLPTNTPIMMDMKQFHTGTPTGWYDATGTIPWSSHIQRSGEPVGGNFLFQDSAVRWYKSGLIELGATVGGWQMYYKIPLNR